MCMSVLRLLYVLCLYFIIVDYLRKGWEGYTLIPIERMNINIFNNVEKKS